MLCDLIDEFQVNSIIDFGCGDGNQASRLPQDVPYLGLDVSPTIIKKNQKAFKLDNMKSFLTFDSMYMKNAGMFLNADMVISLDVLYHLVEDEIYSNYLSTLFEMARRYVVIYAPDDPDIEAKAPHVKIRAFTPYVEANFDSFKLVRKIENKHFSDDAKKSGTKEWSWCDFYLYGRK